MSINKSGVATDLRRFATFFKGLIDAADTLDDMQRLEEEANAAKQQTIDARKQLATVQAEIGDADRQLVDIRAKGSASVKDAAKRAEDKAAAVLAAADAQAVQIINGATSKATQIVNDAQTQHDVLVEQLTSMGDQLLRMTDDKNALDETLTIGRAALDELEGKLAAAREAVAKLFG